MITGTSSGQLASQHGELTCVQHAAIDSVDAEWDRFVSRDVPHLRSGFLRAVERSGIIHEPAYLMVYLDGQPAAAALGYTLAIDAAQSALPGRQRLVTRIRKVFPRFMWRSLRICGSPIENGEGGVYFSPRLPAPDRRQVFRRIADEVLRSSRRDQTIYFKDFDPQAVAEYASELEQLGFFAVDPGPATRLTLEWSSFGDYLAAMHGHYRGRIRKDLQAAEKELEFQVLDAFAELAPVATALYANVVAHARFTSQQANERFFAAVSDFDQAELLVARHRATGQVLGINLLLFGDTCLHNEYIGFDYDANEKCRTYFSLFEHSVRLALERNCRVCYLGPASYEFKARLGAAPIPLAAYMKHRLWPIHHFLRSSRDRLFPKREFPSRDVFRAERDRQPVSAEVRRG